LPGVVELFDLSCPTLIEKSDVLLTVHVGVLVKSPSANVSETCANEKLENKIKQMMQMYFTILK
jgi:hypothetical protein